MKDFMLTSAGKAVFGVFLSALLLAWPPALSWLVAAVSLVFAVQHLRESFRRLDADAAGDDGGPGDADTADPLPASRPMPAHRDGQHCDVEAVMASLAAQMANRSHQPG